MLYPHRVVDWNLHHLAGVSRAGGSPTRSPLATLNCFDIRFDY
jgi:hypothetical protein